MRGGSAMKLLSNKDIVKRFNEVYDKSAINVTFVQTVAKIS